MHYRGFILPGLLIGFTLVLIIGSIFYFSKNNAASTSISSTPSSNTTTNSTPSASSPKPLKPYKFDQAPDKEIHVVTGGFNFLDLTIEVMKLNNPSVNIDFGKQDWMILQTKTPSKKTNTASYDKNFHTLVAFAPPKNLSGKHDLKITISDNGSPVKSLFVRVSLISEPIPTDIKLPPKNLKAAMV